VTATGRALRYGLEVWRADVGVEWSYWDLWFAVLCVRDHGGDWAGLDAAITAIGYSDGEVKWSHLLDLRERLDAAGLGARELVAEAIGEKGLITRARARVFKQGVSWRDMTPAMRNPPSRRLECRARCGWWPEFPSSPQEPHDRLVTLLRLDRHCRSAAAADGWATRSLAGDLAEAAQLLETGEGPGILAVRRAMLTIGLDLAECCDDSYGALGDVIGESLEDYAGTDWRSAGLPPRVFWPDFLEIATMLGNYGVLHRREVELFCRAGVAADLDDVSGVAAKLHADYVAARMTWHADEVRMLYVHAIVAAGALDRFETTARQIGSASWVACEAMVQAALEQGRIDVAQRTLDAADMPGVHQERVRRRRAELDS
ncbi:MAG: hypothetical protein M3R63_24935, partial [Actinomycetota bacterium]|nr:hypothetical protein [Actinomycetota bacterium]